MTLEQFLEGVRRGDVVTFDESLRVVDEYYHYQAVAFQNGTVNNTAGQNENSCRLFAFARRHGLNAEQTLRLFGEHYRNVLDNPQDSKHPNLRAFIQHGWSGIVFADEPLRAKVCARFDPATLNHLTYVLRCLGQGFALLARPELRHFIWMPLLLNLCLYALGLWATHHYFEVAVAYFLPAWLSWLHWFLWPLVAGVFIILMFFSFTLLVNLLGAPFYGILAEKVAVLLGLPPEPRHEESWWGTVGRGMVTGLARLRYYGVHVLPILLLFVIPVINVVAPLLWLIFNGWFLMLEYTSYPLERYGCSFDEQRRLLAQARIAGIGFGVAVIFGLAVPLLNVLIPPAAVAGAVIYIAGARR
ncbi:CysZ protein [Gammaproteobacteria bacterium]